MSRGGARTGAGRKPVPDKKVSLTIMIKSELKVRLQDESKAQNKTISKIVEPIISGSLEIGWQK